MIMGSSKWKPMACYEHSGVSYLIMAKMCKSGFIRFKRSRITGIFHVANSNYLRLDFTDQFESLLKENV